MLTTAIVTLAVRALVAGTLALAAVLALAWVW